MMNRIRASVLRAWARNVFPVLTPVRAPVGIALSQPKLEAADTDFVDLSEYAADEFPTCGKLVAHEIRIRIVESIEQYLEEVGRMGQILNVDRHHRESRSPDGRASNP